MTAPLDSLRALLGSDETLRAELVSAEGTDAFTRTTAAIARRHGIMIEPADLAPLTAPDPVYLVQHEVPAIRYAGWPPPGWLPYRMARDADGAPAIDWADFTGISLDGRFYTEAVRLALTRPLNRLLRCRTGLADFLAGPPEGLRAPDGFIFHMSRCGSTLVARLLAALPETYAINEAGPIDAMLQASTGAPEDVRIAALRAMIGAFGHRPSGRWFVKLSTWPTLSLPLFRRAFPGVPWIFAHRDPAEVLASQMATRAPELAPAFTPSSLFGIEDGAALPDEIYCAMALSRVCEAALAADGGLFVDHADLPEAFLSAILPHFGIGAKEAPRGALREIAGQHAKHPDAPYRPGEVPTDPAVRAAADTHLAALHTRLKAVRGGKSLL